MANLLVRIGLNSAGFKTGLAQCRMAAGNFKKSVGGMFSGIGAQILDIEGCSFIDSGRGGYSIRLDDAPWEKITVGALSFENSGGIMSNRKFDL